MAHLQEHASEDVSDNFQFDADMGKHGANDSGNHSGDDPGDSVLHVYVAGYTLTHLID